MKGSSRFLCLPGGWRDVVSPAGRTPGGSFPLDGTCGCRWRAVIGTVAAILLGRPLELGSTGLVLLAVFQAASLASWAVVCVALFWAVPVRPNPAAPRDLWDPWLDAQNGSGAAPVDATLTDQEPVGETAGEISHWRARVRPSCHLARRPAKPCPRSTMWGRSLRAASPVPFASSGSGGLGENDRARAFGRPRASTRECFLP